MWGKAANIIGRNFTATGPWQKLGTDVEFKLSFGKAYLARFMTLPVKQIAAYSISMCPNLPSSKRCFRYCGG